MPSRFSGVVVVTMGSTMLLLILSLVGFISANPYEEFRSSNLEFLQYSETNLDNPAYRLLDIVQPRYFDIDLDVYLSESRFDGVATIEVDVLESVQQIVLHQKVVSINIVSVYDAEGAPVGLQFPDTFETDDYYELLKINFDDVISNGTYKLVISYTGQINENPFDRGFYKGYYYAGDEKRYYATTQFQPYHARKAFPCFDEPQFKSRFVISITRDGDLSNSYSNMAINDTQVLANNRVKETFLPTPIVSVYLIAFHVSDFIETNSTATAAKPFGIVSRPYVTNQHPYAAEIGLQITNELDDYLAIGYYDMGDGQPMKNDHIALPDFPSGAMENWGMVNYREAYLLYDEANTNLQNKIFIATIMAHELAHKWFGNLVTCFWWSNLWLNESYASFFEYFAAHYADPSLELDEQFVVDYVHSALNNDAFASATPMNWSEVASNPSITAHFSVSSYAKGASVLRMMEHFVGETTFRNALRYYLSVNAYGLGTPSDMYAAFTVATANDATFASSYPGIDVEQVFDSYVQNAGAPVLNINVDMSTGDITIEQERFQMTGTPVSPLWQIPITWTEGGNPNFDNTKPSFVLNTASTVLEGAVTGHNWAIFNIRQSGYYRVNYDDHTWEMIASSLRNDPEQIHYLNRAQIVNDVLHFLRAGKISVERAFDVLSFLENETNYYVWSGALSQLDWIRRRLEHLPLAYTEFSNYLSEQLETAIQHLGFEESASDSTSTILNRMVLLNYACNLGHEGCVTDSLQKWEALRNQGTPVPVNSRRYVYCSGIRNGNATDYNFLFGMYNSSENTADMVVILRGLGCTTDASLLTHYLEQSLYNDRIRLHDRTNAFSFALQGNKQNLNTVLDFVYQRYQDISDNYGGEARLVTAINTLSTYLTDVQDIAAFQTWLYTNQLSLGSAFNAGKNVITSSINNLVWTDNIATELYTVLHQRNSASVITSPFLLLLIALAAHVFH